VVVVCIYNVDVENEERIILNIYCERFSGRCARDKVCSVILSKINQCKCDGGKTNVPCITAAINGDTSKLVTDLVSCGKKFCNN